MQSPSSPNRINSIDILRGLVMIVMALDHVRDYFSNYGFEPTDLHHASTIMFFTRWITHYCAPVFIFLSGTSAFLSMGKGRTKKQESWRLLTRGLWLVVLEVTIVRLGWTFNLNYHLVILQVIWAIGVSMIVLSGLIFLPLPVIAVIALTLIFGHDLADGLHPAGTASVFWQLLHVQGPLTFDGDRTLFIIYPLIPWIGVMAAGFCFGRLFKEEAGKRATWQWMMGLSAMLLFVLLRYSRLYGDPSPWVQQGQWWRSILSFLNCSKYPPSLLYLLMTLGPAIAMLPLLERLQGRVAAVLKVYGSVPLFYYILHIYLVHTLSVLAGLFIKGEAMHNGPFAHPGYPLYVVYLVWLLAVVILYFPCKWFRGIKKSHHYWWLSYL